MKRPAAAPNLSVRLFGNPEIEYRERISGTGVPPKTFALLALVLLQPSRRIERQAAAAALWPEEPEDRALANLRRYLYRLTTTLLPAGDRRWLTTTTRFIEWNPAAPVDVDVEIFERASKGSGDLAAALDAYRGDLMASFDEAWLVAPRERLRSAFAAAGHAALEHATPRSAIALAKRLLAHDPFDEIAVRAIVRGRAACGDRIGALREYDDFRHAAIAELGVEPSDETRAVRDALVSELRQDFGFERDVRLARLPFFRSPLFGRDAERHALGESLTSRSAVVLLGIGGIGKTRLAIELATSAIDLFPGGAAFVDVARAESDDRLPQIFAESLGLPALARDEDVESRAATELRRAAHVVVLDNCERRSAAVSALLERIVPVSGDSRFIVATRERLDVPDAIVHRVRPLDRSSAAAFFVERASHSETGADPRTFDSGVVDAIVEKLDGIPLAIELAATRAANTELADLGTRLAQAISAQPYRRGRPSQRKTMGVVLDWSYAALDGRSARVFRHLATFAGNWTADRARDLFEPEDHDDVSAALQALADAALVVVDYADVVRYRYLDPVRTYALAQLERLDDAPAVRRRHATTILRVAEEFCARGHTLPMQARTARASAEVDDLRAALRWALLERNDVALGRRLAAAAEYFAFVDPDEGRSYVTRALAALDDESEPTIEARLYNALARSTIASNRYREAFASATRAIDIARSLGDDETLCAFLVAGVFAAGGHHLLDEAEAFAIECIALARRLGLRRYEVQAKHYLPVIFAIRGDYDRAREQYEEILDGETVSPSANATACWANYAETEYQAGRIADAARLAAKAIAVGEAAGDARTVLIARANLGGYLCILGRVDDARAEALRTIEEARNAGLQALVTIAIGTLAEIAETNDRVAEATALAEFVRRRYDAYGFERTGAFAARTHAFIARLADRLDATATSRAIELAESWDETGAIDVAIAASAR